MTRTFVLLLLLWAGGDLGSHGLFASDFSPMASRGSSTSLCVEDGDAGAASAPDYCFCHATSMAAAVPALISVPTPVGTFVTDRPLQIPLSDPHSIDRPPQPAA